MPTDQVMEQEFEAIPPKEEKPKQRIILMIGGLTIFVVTIVLLLLFLTARKPGEKNFFPVVPSPIPTIVKAPIHPSSPYATDAAVLKIEDDLKSLDRELENTDLKEAGLNPPVLDMKAK